jgi:hypothetical protein
MKGKEKERVCAFSLIPTVCLPRGEAFATRSCRAVVRAGVIEHGRAGRGKKTAFV